MEAFRKHIEISSAEQGFPKPAQFEEVQILLAPDGIVSNLLERGTRIRRQIVIHHCGVIRLGEELQAVRRALLMKSVNSRGFISGLRSSWKVTTLLRRTMRSISDSIAFAYGLSSPSARPTACTTPSPP